MFTFLILMTQSYISPIKSISVDKKFGFIVLSPSVSITLQRLVLRWDFRSILVVITNNTYNLSQRNFWTSNDFYIRFLLFFTETEK